LRACRTVFDRPRGNAPTCAHGTPKINERARECVQKWRWASRFRAPGHCRPAVGRRCLGVCLDVAVNNFWRRRGLSLSYREASRSGGPMARVRVFVQAGDPISAVGLASYIRAQPGMLVVPSRLPADADVALTVTDRVNADFIGALTKAAQAA